MISLCALSIFSDHCLYNLHLCLLALRRTAKCRPVAVTLHGLGIVTLYFVVSVKSVSVFLIVSKVVVPCCEGGTKVFLTLFASV